MSNLPVVKKEGQRSNEIIQLVSFELGGEEYGVDVLTVREIIRMPSITKMPNTPDYVDGIINLRGMVVPIISLRRRFALSERGEDRDSRILVMEVGSGLTGFVVDAVAEVIRISAAEIQPSPPVVQGNAAQECITGVINHGERLLIVLDMERLFTDEEKQRFVALE
ncbi:chemotaxis protein CheW [Geobacter sp. SVR]|uniref:chemotaxis protein CheW n=1 Tax=Geobacter sp. SVR TaxID=2495594 RepID=UPI00143EF4A6|nr:chemotaxis protein CheW [Geobacter sp. SVR]BCS54794.1 chemotaxis protein CheW [Geobacter sp. SVR]GCF86398.1 chemotaxis protein CheW [Geobacter sp. SVR]